jgi:sulfotransferase
MGPNNEAETFITDGARERVLRGVVENYYADDYHNVIFDNNRRWTANIGMVDRLFPQSKIVCCLRNPAAIVDSFERLFQKNPLDLSIIYGGTANLTVYERVGKLMEPTAVVGFALNAFRTAFFGPYHDKLICVSYDDLCRFPAAIMNELTKALDLPPHNYQFDAIEQVPGTGQFDKEVATPGLHTLKPKVVYEQRTSVLPPDIWNALPPPFWQVKEPVTPVE